jgi:hypothetical protein
MNVLEKDVVMGTFTHRETYLPGLCESIREHLPHILFVLQLANQPINVNFNALREKFIQTGKRFWLFLDDDIKFLFPDTIRVALETMLRNRYAMVGVYSTFDPEFVCNPKELNEREVNWLPGYFQLVDSSLVGHIQADMDLPDGNTAIDTSYSVRIKQNGNKIGMAPTYVYHTYKSGSWVNPAVIEPTNQYLMKRYGKQYFEWCHGFDNILGGVPESLASNRVRLMEWQKKIYFMREPEKLKLHMGCGDLKLPGYINCDIDGFPDEIYDMTTPGKWKNGTVDHITCHHVLEHVHYRLIPQVLKEWHRMLKVGGTVDVGMPDLNLICQEWNGTDESNKWNRLIYTIYGLQGTTDRPPIQLTEADPIVEGQCHKGGMTLERLCWLLRNLGFAILESYNYDGNGTPSLFVLAKKES